MASASTPKSALCIGLASTIAVLVVDSLPAQDAQAIKSPEVLARTIRSAMEEYLRVGTRLCGTVRERLGAEGTDKLWVDATIQIKQNGRHGYMIERRWDRGLSGPTWKALLYGPRGSALLGKATDGRWYVSEYAAGVSEVRESCWILSHYTARAYFIKPGPDWSVAFAWWSDSVEIQSIEWTGSEDAPLLKAEYKINHPLRRRVGSVWVDPERMWAIVKGEEWREGETGEPAMLTIEYDETFRPAPVPKLVHMRWRVKNEELDGYAWWRSEFEFRIPEQPLSDEEFTLAAFGIDRARIHWPPADRGRWLWLGILTTALSAVLWWLRYRLVQRRQACNEQQG